MKKAAFVASPPSPDRVPVRSPRTSIILAELARQRRLERRRRRFKRRERRRVFARLTAQLAALRCWIFGIRRHTARPGS